MEEVLKIFNLGRGRLEMSSCGRTSMSTHHGVLECQPITLFLRHRPSKMFLTVALLLTAEATLCNARGAECGAAAAFRKEELTIFARSFIFLHFLIFFHCVK